jgi:hypothetical protein
MTVIGGSPCPQARATTLLEEIREKVMEVLKAEESLASPLSRK